MIELTVFSYTFYYFDRIKTRVQKLKISCNQVSKVDGIFQNDLFGLKIKRLL